MRGKGRRPDDGRIRGDKVGDRLMTSGCNQHCTYLARPPVGQGQVGLRAPIVAIRAKVTLTWYSCHGPHPIHSSKVRQ